MPKLRTLGSIGITWEESELGSGREAHAQAPRSVSLGRPLLVRSTSLTTAPRPFGVFPGFVFLVRYSSPCSHLFLQLLSNLQVGSFGEREGA